MNAGVIETRAQLTAKVFLAAAISSAEFFGFGNLSGHKIEIKRESQVVTKAMKGFHQELKELTTLVGVRFEFDLDEETWRANEVFFMSLAKNVVSAGVVTAPTGTATINAVKQGYSYFISTTVRDFNAVVVKVSSVTKTLGTDYNLDAATGEIYIIPGGGINDADNLAITYGTSAWSVEAYQPLTYAQPRNGAMRLVEFDQHSANGVAYRDHQSSDVQFWIDGGEQHDGKKPTTRKLKILCGVIPTVYQRAA